VNNYNSVAAVGNNVVHQLVTEIVMQGATVKTLSDKRIDEY
jgi:hypothetical protein